MIQINEKQSNRWLNPGPLLVSYDGEADYIDISREFYKSRFICSDYEKIIDPNDNSVSYNWLPKPKINWNEADTEIYIDTLLNNPQKLGIKKHIVRFIKSKPTIVENFILKTIRQKTFRENFNVSNHVAYLLHRGDVLGKEVKYMFRLCDFTKNYIDSK